MLQKNFALIAVYKMFNYPFNYPFNYMFITIIIKEEYSQ